MTKEKSQFEKDIESVIKFLKQTDPKNATRAKAIEMLGSMQTLSHLIAHKVVDKERSEKLKKEIKKRKTKS
ncbi:hypothetical protein ACFL0Y_01255 [Patescibacteria group bacterium]